jgi:DNA-directed RNA polymerase specialized sigma24 family protein
MPETKQQLDVLLADPGYSRTLALLTREVMQLWRVSYLDARGFVLSAIGEPTALASIYEAWVAARATGENRTHPLLISRRRVIDLLRKDARRPGHSSLPVAANEIEGDETLGSLHTDPQRDPEVQLQRQQCIELVRRAIACFGGQGKAQERQAELLKRRALDEITYAKLSVELACTENALRVRLHAAMRAFHRHILSCHPELLSLRTTIAGERTL